MSDDSGFGFVASGAEGGSSFLVSNGSLLPFLEAKKARNRRYMLLRELSRAVWSGTLPAHGVRYCSRKAIPAETQKKDGTWVPTGMPGHIEVQSRDEGTRHSYHGLGRCASPLVCPFCSAVIQAHRAAEVMRAGQYMLAHGFQVAMVTLTASHSRTTSLVDFVARFQAAQRDMRMHRQFKNWQKTPAHDLQFRRSKQRTTTRTLVGANWLALSHAHTFLFRKAQGFYAAGSRKVYKNISKMWVKALEGVGLEGSLERAARVDLPRANEKLDAARAQESSESVNNLCAYISKAFGWEMAGGRNKKGREQGRRISVWELQAAALTDRPDLLPRYAEYMRAIKGVNWLRWSQGLRQFCGIVEESDKEILERGEAGEETIWIFSDSEFAHVWRQGGQGKILDAADREGATGIAKAMEAAMQNCDIETESSSNDFFVFEGRT